MSTKLKKADPYSIDARVNRRISELLDDEAWNEMSMGEKVRCIGAIAQIRYRLMSRDDKLDKSGFGGETVKRYEKAFAANASRQRKTASGGGDIDPILDPDFDEETEH